MTAIPPRKHYDLCDAAHDYPVWEGPPRRTVLICSHARSGSTMLGEALYFAGGLGCALEYLHIGFRPGFEDRWGATGLKDLTHQVWRHRTDPSGTLGVKLFWRDVADLVEALAPDDFPCLRTAPAAEIPAEAYRALGDLLQGLFPNPIAIHLERGDRLRQAVSASIATQSGVWRRIGARDEPARAVCYDAGQIEALLVSSAFCHAHWQAFFRANALPAYPIVYEDLVADYHEVVERLLRHLGHSGSAPHIRMERQGDAQSEAWMQRFLRERTAAMR